MKIKRFDSINVIPFIDIMLVILVIVLTTATFISKGKIPISLPSAKSAKVDKKKSLNIKITKDGKIYINEKVILKENFAQQIETFDKNSSVKISCDKDLKFEDFVYILDSLKLKEFNNIGIVTKNE